MTSDSVISLISNSGRIKILGGIGGKTNLMHSLGVSQAAILRPPNSQGEAERTKVPGFPTLPPLALPLPLMLLRTSGAAHVP